MMIIRHLIGILITVLVSTGCIYVYHSKYYVKVEPCNHICTQFESNIYTSDGTLSSKRSVILGDNKLQLGNYGEGTITNRHILNSNGMVVEGEGTFQLGVTAEGSIIAVPTIIEKRITIMDRMEIFIEEHDIDVEGILIIIVVIVGCMAAITSRTLFRIK